MTITQILTIACFVIVIASSIVTIVIQSRM